MDLQLAGKTVLITGGSKGIGKASAEVLAAEGCNLILVARDPAVLNETAAEIRNRHQVNVRTIPADLSSDASVRKVATPFTEAPPQMPSHRPCKLSVAPCQKQTWPRTKQSSPHLSRPHGTSGDSPHSLPWPRECCSTWRFRR